MEAQVAARYQLFCGVSLQPSLAKAEQFFDLVIRNVVVLVIIQHRNKYIQMSQKLTQWAGAPERNSIVVALTPLRKLLVKSVTFNLKLIA